MSHAVQTMAYLGAAPWHQIGNQLPPKQSIEVWAEKAGMDWSICEAPVRYMTEQAGVLGSIMSFDEQKVLYRSDTKAPLSVVGDRFRVVQPLQILDFFREISDVSGLSLETAGCLKGGRKFWALARTGKEATLKGSDTVHSYVLLASGCDGSLATTATHTSTRVVCANTLAIALNGATNAIKVPHRTSFDAMAVKKQLGIAVSQWDTFMQNMKLLAERKVKRSEAMQYLLNVVSDTAAPPQTTGLANERALKRMLELFDGHGRGAELAAAKGTAWGLLNSVTEYVDHERRARSPEARLDGAWFGPGAALKQRALDQAMQLIS
ncbi:MAG: DUF932 domain-containing protein [Roseateles sp.]|uniref:DUF932 domain-containing protein n=1 Tax=Roseateles sp. TaxID=1971397 RepID=UPI004035C104